jgi:hypothetical protein
MLRKFFILTGVVVLAGSVSAQNLGRNWGNIFPGGLAENRTNPDIRYLAATAWSPGSAVMMTNYNSADTTEDPNQDPNTTYSVFINDRIDDLGQFTNHPFRTVGVDGPHHWRFTPPSITQDGTDVKRTTWTIFPNEKDGVNPSLGSDLYSEGRQNDSVGINQRSQTFRWSHPDFHDVIFQIWTYAFPTVPAHPDLQLGIERGSSPAPEIAARNPSYENFHIGHHWAPYATNRGPSGGSHITPEPGSGSRWIAAGLGQVGLWDEINYWDDTRKIFYSHDGDATDAAGYRADGDDRGEPAPGPGGTLDSAAEALVGPGEFMESYYKARIYLHVDKTPVAQGSNTLSDNWLDDANEADPELRQPRTADIIPDASWRSTASNDVQSTHEFYTQPNTTRDQRIFVSDVDQAGWAGSSQRFQEWLTVFGPWTISPGEEIKIVSAWVIAGPSLEENKRMGALWQSGGISFAEKEAFLDSGLDSMNAAIATAELAWANRNVIPDVGLQPVGSLVPAWPSSITINSGPDQNELSWASVGGAVSYNIYRMAGFETRPRELVANVTGTTYNDNNAVRGTRYFYSVTAVDGNGVESDFFAGRSEADGVSPFRAPSSQLSNVRVVPNPFQIKGGDISQGGFNFPGQPDKLLFVGLPGSAIVRIFSVTGDLIQELQHTAGSGDLSWDLMISDNNQFLTSGIYFAHITSTDATVSGTHIEKFVVVR